MWKYGALISYLMMFSGAVIAADIGYCHGAGKNQFYVNFNVIFSASTAGAIAKGKWGKVAYYDVLCTNSTNIATARPKVTTESTLPPSALNRGYLKLTDDVDVQIAVDGFPNNTFVPFELVQSTTMGTIPAGPYVDMLEKSMVAGSAGTITFKLRRNIVAGGLYIPAEQSLFKMFSIYWSKSELPLLELKTKGEFIQLPSTCVVNNGQDMNVNFGDLMSDRISFEAGINSNYRKEIEIPFDCKGPAFEKNTPLLVRLVSKQSAYSVHLISTSVDNLGILIKANGLVVDPNEEFKVQHQSGKGVIKIVAAPVKKDSGIVKAGRFDSTAILLMVLP